MLLHFCIFPFALEIIFPACISLEAWKGKFKKVERIYDDCNSVRIIFSLKLIIKDLNILEVSNLILLMWRI
jgi:hypothetical protein